VVFAFLGGERLYQGMSAGKGHIGCDLSSQGTMAHGFEPSFEGIEDLFVVEIGKLFAKALEIAKGIFIDKTGQAKELQKGILKWRSREQQLWHISKRLLECVGNDVGRLINVAQPWASSITTRSQ